MNGRMSEMQRRNGIRKRVNTACMPRVAWPSRRNGGDSNAHRSQTRLFTVS